MVTKRDKLVARFFAYARERQRILLRRQVGQPPPWTNDPYLQQWKFCNVFREDDRTTVWFREHIRAPLAERLEVLPATVAFRWFNRVEIGEVLLDPSVGLLSEGFEFKPERAEELIRAKFPRGPWVTGAYVVKTPTGMDKLRGVLWCISRFRTSYPDYAFHWDPEVSLEGMWSGLMASPFLGEFMAYEVVTDLRHTMLLRNAPDILTWANPGPGAARGMCRVLGLPIEALNRHSKADRFTLLAEMRRLLKLSRDAQYWPATWGQWEMREVEHTLCEFDKYERAREGGKLKQRFRGRDDLFEE